MNKKNKKIIFKFGIMIIFILLLITPIAIGYIEKTNIILVNKKYLYENYNIYDYPEYVAKEKFPDFYYKKDNFNIKKEAEEYSNNNYQTTLNESLTEKQIQSLDGPMNSPWPMQGHDTRHTGRSPYSTTDTWDEIWNFEISGWPRSPTIDKNGTIYIGGYYLYAVYLNGTLKWNYHTGLSIKSAPAIDENGIIYFGIAYGWPSYLCAVYPNGTLKWKFYVADSIFSSPTIGDDGTIYFGYGGGPPTGYINALYPNGTLRWSFQTNHAVYSSPAIGLDGTIYCGSHDGYVYALYPNNGTLRWKYNTGSWVHGSPTIADDGTVYIGSDNCYFYAFYPVNGTVKWSISIGEIYGSPALDKDGTIYTGVWENSFYAIYPNGTIKWSFNPGAHIWGSSPALSDDSTLYFGTCDLEWSGGVEIIALYTDGTVKWRKSLDTVFSSPAIGSDGTVYIGSISEPGEGFLHAFGIGPLEADAHGPYYGLINQSVQFKGSASGGYSPYTSWHWSFGDNGTSDEKNPTHVYTNPGNYTVTLTVTDNTSNTSSDTTWAWIQTTNNPPDKPTINGTTKGEFGISYDYKFKTIDPDGTDILWYFVDWGDGRNTGWIGPYSSDEEITRSHFWYETGKYTIGCKAKDPYNAESDWGKLEVTMPRNKVVNPLLLRFLERFPMLERILFESMQRVF